MKFIVDASVAIRWLLADFHHHNASLVLRMILDRPGDFAVPELFLYETYAVLSRFHPDSKTIFDEDIYPLIRSGVLRYPMTPGIYKRAGKYITLGLTGYDSAYMALAEELDARWLTFDAKAHAKVIGEDRSYDLNESNFTL